MKYVSLLLLLVFFFSEISDNQSEVVLRFTSKPKSITVSGKAIKQLNGEGYLYIWKAHDKGGMLKYAGGNKVEIIN